MEILKIISKPAALGSGWTSAILCFSAVSGCWSAAEHWKSVFWVIFGLAEVLTVVW
jgi:hypothetical protein